MRKSENFEKAILKIQKVDEEIIEALDGVHKEICKIVKGKKRDTKGGACE